jgi:hypothetical protein
VHEDLTVHRKGPIILTFAYHFNVSVFQAENIQLSNAVAESAVDLYIALALVVEAENFRWHRELAMLRVEPVYLLPNSFNASFK